MIKLTDYHFENLKRSWRRQVVDKLHEQASGQAYRDQVESLIFENDIGDEFIKYVNETYDRSDFSDWCIVEWIRDLQHDAINNASLVPISLETFICDKFNGFEVDFANAQGVKEEQVTEWIKKEYIVVDNQLYSRVMDLKLNAVRHSSI